MKQYSFHRLSTFLCLSGYALFLLSSLLFVILPSPNKQFFGYQFYLMMEEYPSLGIHGGDVVVVKRTPFLSYKKGDTITYLNQDDIPLYLIQQIQDIDVANFTILFTQHSHQYLIPKEQIKGIVVNVIPKHVIPSPLLTDFFILLAFLFGLLLLYQVIRDSLDHKHNHSHNHTNHSF